MLCVLCRGPLRAGACVQVEDVNEVPVVADQNYALDVAVPVRVVLVARDPDSQLKPQFSRMTFTILATNDTQSYFQLDTATGVMTGPALSIDTDMTMNAWYFLVRASGGCCFPRFPPLFLRPVVRRRCRVVCALCP